MSEPAFRATVSAGAADRRRCRLPGGAGGRLRHPPDGGLAARPVAIFTALAGSCQVDTAAKAFISWFGPKGVATMTFTLFVLGSAAPDAQRIAGIAALAVFVSIIAHGLTDHPGAEWMARRAERVPQAA